MTLEANIRLTRGAFRLEAAFAAPAGITAIFGPSGSGKSSLLAALAGLTPIKGQVMLEGRARTHLAPHRRGIGMVFQDARLFPHMTVRQNLLYAHRRAARPRDIAEMAGFFDIDMLLDRPVTNLSGGEKSRVALARALVAAPELLLLDEPFAALDGQRRRGFTAVLREVHRRFALPMLVVTHSIDDACALADHIVALKDGRIAAAGRFKETAYAPTFRALLDPRDVGAAVAGNRIVSGRADIEQAHWLRADQVLLAARRPEAISARNILEGRVTAIVPEDDGSLLVELDTAAGFLLSRLTPQAVTSLVLAPGVAAWAVFKAHSI